MNDKERILMQIIQGLRTAESLARPNLRGWEAGDVAYDDGYGGQYVHFAPWVGDEELKPGELVMCQTGNISDWKIGFVVRRIEYGRCLIREIGSDRTCDYSNERFIPIRGLSPTELLEGDDYQFYLKVLKAFDRGDEFWHRFGGVDITGRHATILVRERYGGIKYKSGTKPFPIEMDWTPKTTIKAILEAMREGGYGAKEKEFELVNPDEAKEEKRESQ